MKRNPLPKINLSTGDRNPAATSLLILLFLIDTLLITLHVANVLSCRFEWLDINSERSVAGVFQFLKLASIAMILLLVSAMNRSILYLAWVQLFSYLLLDDLLTLHETGGEWLAEAIGLYPSFGNLVGADIGQIIYAAIVGPLLFIPIVAAFWLGRDKFRRETRTMTGLLGMFAVFAIGVDLVHASVRGWSVVYAIALLVEESGEMFALSLTLWYCTIILLHERRDTPKLRHLLLDLLPIKKAAARSSP